jgi:hypothetical protein
VVGPLIWKPAGRTPDPTPILQAVFAELVELLAAIPEDDFVYRLTGLIRHYLSGNRSYLLAVLPEKAKEKLAEVDAALDAEAEEDRRRADQMGY